jgi:ADP-heptose:LPS heptosyltransferase
MSLPLHVRIRQKLKISINSLLSRLFPDRVTFDPIPSENIQRILIIRINYRIGNLLFLTPLLRALNTRFPNTPIDILIGAAYPAPLLKEFDTVENVFDFPRELLKNPLKAFRYARQLRSTHYDVVINLNNGSASDRLATLAADGTYKLGFTSEYNWLPLTHVVDAPPTRTHEALKPLYLMKAFGNQPTDYPQHMDISLSDEEKREGAKSLQNRLEQQGLSGSHTRRIAIFRDARRSKKIDDAWWSAWHIQMKNLNPQAIFIDILSPDIPEKLNDDFYTLSEPNLRILGTMLSQLDIFVCGDTGPMHLAGASGVPTMALFKASAPTLYGTLGQNDRSIEIAHLTPEATADIISIHLSTLTTNFTFD